MLGSDSNLLMWVFIIIIGGIVLFAVILSGALGLFGIFLHSKVTKGNFKISPVTFIRLVPACLINLAIGFLAYRGFETGRAFVIVFLVTILVAYLFLYSRSRPRKEPLIQAIVSSLIITFITYNLLRPPYAP